MVKNSDFSKCLSKIGGVGRFAPFECGGMSQSPYAENIKFWEVSHFA
jgi:hypothetical protein